MITLPMIRALPAFAVLAALLATAAAFAQTSPQAAPQTAPGPPITAQNAAGDPPARVGRLAQMNGTVSFHTADADQWSPATLNYPVTSGNALWTEPGARAELQIGSGSRLVMDGGTELDIATLDDRTLAAGVPQGRVFLQVDSLANGERYTVHTPRGELAITAPGRYVVAAGDDDHPGIATVLDGAAAIAGRPIPVGQTATLSGPLDGDKPAEIALAPAQPDSFIESVQGGTNHPPLTAAAPAAPAQVPAVAMPQQMTGMTGAQDLAATGTWSSEPQYGSVWYPPVAAGWVPYRDGHWAWVPPWGWTWVADEPWGFAPFHYGRWVVIHDRWAWSPGIHVEIRYGRPRPVYAPALVVFFGGGASLGVLTEDVGWVPLGWHEAYYPPYRVSRAYIRNVNITHVTNITRVTNVSTVNRVTINNYHNIRSATVVNRTVMQRARPVQHSMTPVPRQQFANLHPSRQPAIRPAAASAIHSEAPGPHIAPHASAAPQVRPAPAPSHQTQRQTQAPHADAPHVVPRPQSRPQPPQETMVRQQEARRQQEVQMQQHQAARQQDAERMTRAQEQRRQEDTRLSQQRDATQHQEQMHQEQQQRAQQQYSRHRPQQSDDKDRNQDSPGKP